MTHTAKSKEEEEGASSSSSRKYPFIGMKIADYSILDGIADRSPCFKCGKSRKFFCYNCYVPVADLCGRIPQIRLPVKIDIIKHRTEMGKSTAVHAAILAPDDVKIYTYPDIPDYAQQDGVVLIFPSAKSYAISQFFNEKVHLVVSEKITRPPGYNEGTLLTVRLREEVAAEDESESVIGPPDYKYDFKTLPKSCLPIKKAVFIDSTWNQSRGIYKDDRVKCLTSVVLQNRISQFWRHQKGSPRWYLATIEAIHQFLLEVHIYAFGLNRNYRGLDHLEIVENFLRSIKAAGQLLHDVNSEEIRETAPYDGQYDNLLYFFAHMYDLIHLYYDHNELKSYKRPI